MTNKKETVLEMISAIELSEEVNDANKTIDCSFAIIATVQALADAGFKLTNKEG